MVQTIVHQCDVLCSVDSDGCFVMNEHEYDSVETIGQVQCESFQLLY